MLKTKNLEKLIELESNLRTEYQAQLDAKTAEIESGLQAKEEQKVVIAKQLEQIQALSTDASANKKIEQRNRELHQRCENLQEDIATQKKRVKALQKDLSEEREEIKTLKQFDPLRMKKNLDGSKKKLAEKTVANSVLQKSLNQTKSEKAELERKVKELEEKLELLEVPETEAEVEVEAEEAAA